MMDKIKKEATFYYRPIKDDEAVCAFLGPDYVEEDPSKMHFHNLLELAVCRTGQGKINIGKQRFQYEEGTVSVIPASLEHAIIHKEGEKSFWEYVYINPHLFENYLEVFRRDRKIELTDVLEHAIVKNKEEAEFLFAELNLLLNQLRVKEYGYRQIVSALSYAILVEILKMNYERCDKQIENSSEPPQISRHLIRAMDYIEMHYQEKISTDDIARESYVSATFLRTLFQEYFHMPPMQYLNHIRIQNACKLIRKTDDTLSEIAQKVGYDNLSTFINNFKSHTGQTPGCWKEKNRTK